MSRTPLSARSALVTWGPVVVPLPMAAWFAWNLTTDYGLSTSAALAIGALAWVAYGRMAEVVIEHLTGTTHRCPKKGCTFSVRLTGTDAAESRRWQEVAHSHPHHTSV
ncbi:hypothetical protein [Streptomyces sp. ODS28]|uniref:hypothetical protein n=1 Tax=Streptomyces sp. ODS28 TaxID=3136688 RepID=UPI0031E9D992